METADIIRLAGECGDITIAVRAADLRRFADDLIRESTEIARRAREEDRLMTRDEVMRTLGIAPQTLWRWGNAGYVHPVRVGAKVRYWKSEITGLLRPATGENDKL